MFSKKTLAFLDELAANNDRAWFEANRARYEADVREPGMAFIRAIGARLPELSPRLVASDKKVGGSMMRIHRDVRFSKDKSPYKTNLGIQFRHEVGKDVHAPGLYLHVAPDGCFLASGAYTPDRATLARIRAAIDADQPRWVAVNDALPKGWEAIGESLVRPPKGYDADHPLIDELKRKSYCLCRELRPGAIVGKRFADAAFDHFAATADYLRFVCAAVGVPF